MPCMHLCLVCMTYHHITTQHNTQHTDSSLCCMADAVPDLRQKLYTERMSEVSRENPGNTKNVLKHRLSSSPHRISPTPPHHLTPSHPFVPSFDTAHRHPPPPSTHFMAMNDSFILCFSVSLFLLSLSVAACLRRRSPQLLSPLPMYSGILSPPTIHFLYTLLCFSC